MNQENSFTKDQSAKSSENQPRNNNKKTRRKYCMLLLVMVIPIIFVYVIIKCYRTDGNIAFKTAIVSVGIENPEMSFEMLKNRFSDKLIDNKPRATSPTVKNVEIKKEDIPNKVVNPDIDTSSQVSDVTEINNEQQDNKIEIEENIPEEFKGPIIEETFKGGPFPLYMDMGYGFIKNQTKVNSDTLLNKLKTIQDMTLSIDEDPQVLLFSTHATESFETKPRNFYDKRYNSRSTDNDKNVTSIEDKIAEQLRSNGINVIVDKTQHDYPSYNGSYNRSAVTIKNYLKQYPNIKIILDIHRDAIERENGERVKPVAMINGKKAAQIMIISGCDDGTMNFPNWIQNLKFAVSLQNKLEYKYPNLTRPIFLCYRRYNMNITPGSLLIEFGTNSNSLEEVQYSGELMGKTLSELILSMNQK
jgi:stage II sporulation protein P